MGLKDFIRTVSNFPIDGIQFRDITSLVEEPKAFNKSLIELTAYCMDFKVDTLVGIESRGFIFGTPLARDLEVPFIMARKPGKLPNQTVSKHFKLEYGETELHIQKISPIKGKVVIIDEAQNFSYYELLTALTRIGENSKIIICGDIMQSDIKNSGFKEIFNIFNDQESIENGVVCKEFTTNDIKRSEIVRFIVYKLEKN